MVLLLVSMMSQSSWASQEAPIYSMPYGGPVYGDPPRSYHDSRIVNLIFRTTPEALQKLVPKPMIPNTDNLVTVYFGQFNTPDYKSGEFLFKGDTYLEVGFLAPVKLQEKFGGYSLFLYLNKPGPAISGREIWGFPKKDAEIVMTDKDGRVTFTVTRQGTTIMKAAFQRGTKVEPLPKRPARLRYNLKYIPSVKRGAPPDVMQITSYLQDNRLKELYNGKATLELGSTPVDPLGNIPVLEIVRAEYMVIDGGVDYGEVVYDYLKNSD
jgi:acetoacetate decarboxylase